MTTINSGATEYTIEKALKKPLGLYLHIPFCIQKCKYCDFLSFGGCTRSAQKAYIRALIDEISLNAQCYNNKYYVDSIFIGGGTPSLVDETLIGDLMSTVSDGFEIAEGAEISIESNPKTLSENKLKAYLENGINRLSIGAQSLNDNLLQYMGRIHTSQDFIQNYKLARECGFKNINIDMIFSIPGQTKQTWLDSLEQAADLKPEHISFYSLQVEEDTPFFSMLKSGELIVTDDELDRGMYHDAVALLEEKGYQQYEISNAAKEGCQCRHNLKYWSMEDYLGLGLGAHSCLDGIRFSNETDLEKYMSIGLKDDSGSATYDDLGHIVAGSSPFIVWQHENTKEENISEYLFTGMRKISGIRFDDFRNRFGIELSEAHGDVIRKHQGSGLIEINEGYLRFTKQGIDLSNSVLADFV
jgi:oxygen-independent coproporphyrinogen-3 oxidase